MSMLTKDEKLRVFNNDRSVREGSAYADHTDLISPTAGGRFAPHSAPPTTVKGGPDYPPIPSGPWGEPDPVGIEPSLGVDINASVDITAMEPIGGPTEHVEHPAFARSRAFTLVAPGETPPPTSKRPPPTSKRRR
jgi:hypothetical protein